MSIYKYDQQFEHIHALETPFEVGEYEECVFSHVDFGGANLTDFNFSGCVFEHCNLSGVRLDGAILRDCKFEHCKLLGLRFETCNTLIFSVSFADCLLDHSSFYQLKLKKMPLLRCSLKEVDFTEADLSEVNFADCNLMDALLIGPYWRRRILPQRNIIASIPTPTTSKRPSSPWMDCLAC